MFTCLLLFVDVNFESSGIYVSFGMLIDAWKLPRAWGGFQKRQDRMYWYKELKRNYGI